MAISIVYEDPLYKAVADVKRERTGKDEVRTYPGIGSVSFVQDFGVDAFNEVSRKHGRIFKKDGRSYDDIADEYGFEDGEAFVHALLERPTAKDAVSRMVAEWEAAHDAQSLPDDGLAGESWGEYLEALSKAERRILQTKGEHLRVNVAEQKAHAAWAKQAIRDKKVASATAPHRFMQSVRWHLAAAKIAMNKGQHAEAVVSLEKARANHALAVEAAKHKEALVKLRRDIKKSAGRKGVHGAYRENLRALGARFGLDVPAVERPDVRPALVDMVRGEDEYTDMTGAFSDWMLNEGVSMDVKDMTVEQMEELADMVALLWARGRQKTKDADISRKTSVAARVAQALVDTADMPLRTKPMDETTRRKLGDWTDKVIAQGDGLEAMMIRLSGYRNLGPRGAKSETEKNTVDRMVKSQNAEELLSREVLKLLNPHMEQLVRMEHRITQKMGRRIRDEEIPVPKALRDDGHNFWAVRDWIQIALNLGTVENRQRLFGGYPDLSQSAVDKILSHFSPEDLAAVQGVWDAFEHLFPMLDDVHYRENGFRMRKVEAEPLTVGGITLRGGYYPLAYDRRISTRILGKEQVEALLGAEDGPLTAASVRGGMTKSRARNVKLPVDLRNGALTLSRLAETVHYITHAEAVREVSAIFRHAEFEAAYKERFGSRDYEALIGNLKHLANPVIRIDPDKPLDQAAEYLRPLTAVRMLSGNLRVAATQVTASFMAVTEIGWKWYVRGLRTMFHPFRYAKAIREVSPYMARRWNSVDRDMKQKFDALGPEQRRIWFGGKYITYNSVVNAGFLPIQAMDMMSVMPLWQGAYDKAIYEGMSHEEAMDYAEGKVRRTQPVATPIESIGFQRATGITRLFSLFGTFRFAAFGQRQRQYYRAYRDYRLTDGRVGIDGGTYARHLMHDFLLPCLATSILYSAWAGDDLEDEKTWEKIAGDTIAQLFMGVPLANDIFKTAYGGGVSTPISYIFDDMNSVVRAVERYAETGEGEDLQKAVRKLAGVGFFFIRLPVDKWVENTMKRFGEEDE